MDCARGAELTRRPRRPLARGVRAAPRWGLPKLRVAVRRHVLRVTEEEGDSPIATCAVSGGPVGCANSVGPRNRAVCSAIEFTHPTGVGGSRAPAGRDQVGRLGWL